MTNELLIVSGGKWTADGRWVVIGPMIEGGPDTIVFDPSNGMNGPDDCIQFTKDQGEINDH